MNVRYLYFQLEDVFATTPPMSPHMISLTVCRLQRRFAPFLEASSPSDLEEPLPEISLYSDRQVILDESE